VSATPGDAAETTPVPTLTGERVALRPVRPKDAARLREILVEPAVARWWGVEPPDSIVRDLLKQADDESHFVIELGGQVIGSIQYAEEEDPSYRHASIDLFLDTAHQGHGLGRDAIRTLARYLLDERGHHRLTIDPALENERAIRAYRRLGFRPVGVMRNYERGPDGTWHDSLLLDLLKGELI
jgi:aminoglycoside 6'-N-acetyltransferase